jgi:formate dehydrogenase subunit gamma
MRHGTVDEAWVRTHHELWWRQISARERGGAGR